MSHKDVVEFIDKVIVDAAIRAEFKGIRLTNQDAAMKKLIQMATHNGYLFTKTDIDDLCILMAVTEMQSETGRRTEQEKLKRLVNDAHILQETHEMQKMNRRFREQYLLLQQKMQEENRQFALIGNVMKARYDTARNAINNIR